MHAIRLILLGACLTLAGCAGYQLGGSKPAPLVAVHKLHVPFFTNKTLFHRAEVLATNATINALVSDGTYQVSTSDAADAVLTASVESVNFAQVRSSRIDTMRSEELEMTVRIRWSVQGGKPLPRVLASGVSTGSTRFFVDPNLQTARTNALSDAMERAAQAMVSRLANGW